MGVRKKVFNKLDSLEVIASPPSIIAEVLTLIDQESSSAARLSTIILKDPNLTARILRIANSSYYGYRQEVTSVNQAIMIIGQNIIKCLLLSISIYNGIASKDAGNSRELERLWQHLLETAVAAKNAAQNVNYSIVDEAYVAGLLHDFGRIFLLQYFPEECKEIYRLSLDEKFLIDAEREILKTDHQEIGGYIAERWNLPRSLSDIIGNHHPAGEKHINGLSLLAKLVLFADTLSPANFEYPDNLTGASHRVSILDTAGNKIGLSMDDIKNIYCNLPKEVLRNAEGFDLDLGDAFEYLSQANRKLFNLYLELAGAFREREELSVKLLQEERIGGIHESLNIALATLSHYINNATMNISGQCEVLQMLYEGKDIDKVYDKIPSSLESVRSSIRRISVILEELSNLSSIENINYMKNSRAINIEAELKKRLDSNQVLT
ncbi:MAG: HDOD domain-containing protein [Candidatus Zixiibacteriota bacterium]|nr:MAG: HDOD domain-containing protein [candidate division Zixibacteria bacterium]